MHALLAPCPHLPAPPPRMDAGALTCHGASRGAAFYLTALTYTHYLWQHGHVSRAILTLDRAFLAAIDGAELKEWPMPYAALRWILLHMPPDKISGNVRIHFQHLAGRMKKKEPVRRIWCMWACWALVRHVLPHLPADEKHQVDEPNLGTIYKNLCSHGLPGEAEVWSSAMDDAVSHSISLNSHA